MKKILLLMLVLAVALSAMVSCDMLAEYGIDIDAILGNETPDETPDDNTGDQPETPAVDEDLQGAYDYVHQLTKTISEKTGANYTLVGVVLRGDKEYTVNWTVSDDRIVLTTGADGKVTVTVPEPAEDIKYDLTFTIYNEKGESLSRTYKHVVPAFAYTSFAEYAAAAKGEAVVVTGIVSGVISKSTGSSAYGLYIQDLNNEGGYYVWNLTDDPHGVIEVGMTVKVKGNKDLYNGTYEVVSPIVEIVDTTIQPVEPVDFTELYLGATALNDNALVGKQGMLVTVKGVTILEAGDNGYYYFQLGELKTYLRISSSNNPTTKEALENVKSVHGANYGNIADVTGVISIYNGNFYLSPVSADAFSNVQIPERTDAEKVAMELDTLKIDSKVTADKVITLLANGTNYSEVVFAWACESEHAVLADGTLTLTVPDEKTTVTLTVTATCGEASATKSFEITLSKEIISLEDAIAIGAAQEHNTYTEEKYLIAGVITSLYGTNEESALKYGNFVITDENGNTLVVYGLYSADGSVRYDAMEVKPTIGDYIVVLGTLGQYNGTVQTKNAWLLTHTVETSIPSASEIGVANPSYTADKYMITGVISALYGTNEESALKYGNVIIKDADGNEFIVYGMYSSTGATRYDAMTYKPTIGDTITVLGTLGAYNGTAQMKNGWLIACEKGATTPDTPVDPDPENPTPDTGALKVDTAYKFGMIQGNLDNAVYYLAGGMNGYYMESTANINAALDVYVETTDGGYYLYCYVDGVKTYINMVVSGTHVNGAYEATASTVYRYDADNNTLLAVVNDADYWFGTRNDKTYTTIGPCAVSYAGFFCQFYDVPAAHDCTYEAVVTAPTCTAAGFTTHTCTVCGDSYTDSEVAALGHTTTEGTCENCGATIGGTTGTSYVQVTTAEDFTSGTYVIALADGTAISHVDGTWVTAANVTAENGVVTNDNGAVLIITVTDGKATIKDKNGTYIGAKGGNTNGISTTEYQWNVVFNEDGTITFAGAGSDTVYFAYNSDAQYMKFRGYKTSTCNGDPSAYPYSFIAYKLA